MDLESTRREYLQDIEVPFTGQKLAGEPMPVDQRRIGEAECSRSGFPAEFNLWRL